MSGEKVRREAPALDVTPAVPAMPAGALREGAVPEGLEPGKVQLKSLSREGLERFVVEELGEKRFRAGQLFNWMYVRHAASFDAMTSLAKDLRTKLAEVATLHSVVPHEAYQAPDGTTKVTFRCYDNAVVEAVWIPNPDRNTLCVSSQVGCAMGCTFCLTAKMGLVRNLEVGEIVDQVVHIRRLFPEEEHGRLTNIVMMGMGEPLHNYDNVVEALKLMTHDEGLQLSNKKVTVSTSGLVPAIQRLGDDITINLAVSLNATTDVVRDAIMPVNRRWPIPVLMETLRTIPLKQRRRITIEYVLLGGVNDTMDDAARLVKLLKGVPCKVNLIPWNPHPGTAFQRPEPEQVAAFQEYLLARNLNALIRETRGIEAMAACGQLGKPGTRMPKRLRLQVEAAQQASADGAAEIGAV